MKTEKEAYFEERRKYEDTLHKMDLERIRLELESDKNYNFMMKWFMRIVVTLWFFVIFIVAWAIFKIITAG